MSRRPRTVLATLHARQRVLWVLAILFYGVGDAATTLIGLQTAHIAEGGPIAAAIVMRYGVVTLVILKAGILALFYALWRTLETPGRTAIPLSLAVVGVVVTLWNALVLTTR